MAITLEELLEPLKTSADDDAIDEVGANLATHFDALVEPALDRLGASLSWKERTALAQSLGLVARSDRRTAMLTKLVLDTHASVSRAALYAMPHALPSDAIAKLRALVKADAGHDGHLLALARAADPADEPLFRLAARAHSQQIARVAIDALGTIGTESPDTLAVLAHAVVTASTRASASQALHQLAMRRGAHALATALARREEAQLALVRVLDVIEPRHQAQIRIIAGRGEKSAPPAASASVDTAELAGFGAVIDGTRAEHAIRTGDEALVETVAALLTAPVHRSVVLVGASGTGKTNIVHALARTLSARTPSWIVLETATSEVLAGTKFLGEWETRLKKLIDLARAPARVVLYITDVNALATQGTSANRDTSFADAMAPYLDRGELAIVAESTADALRHGMDRHVVMRRAFERVQVREASESETRAVVRDRIAHAGKSFVLGPSVIEQIVETSPLHGAGLVQPGAAARLADQVADVARRRAGGEGEIESSDVVTALSRSTGMPRALLDDRAPFDAAAVRAFFEERVLGQREAVDVVVELVTLVKAGLTDPDRPYGSLFFVGPTGVGKTEIAKALAEHLYGASDRMVRIDMSELRDWDSYEKLIGSVKNASIEGVLTRRVAEQPFSVVLLDEVEKAHSNVHDLLLQLLDDGRLTDARGRTVDFRRTVVVMTSNVGAKIEIDALGFGAKGGEAPSEQAVLREVRRVFRPELVNRFGRTVVFDALTPEIIRTLVRRELGKVIVRSGVLRRRLAVDLAPEVVDLLAREGFSVAYGARPLKRRVERRVLLPLAERIVALGPDAAGTILRVETQGDAITVRAIAPSAPREAASAPPTASRDRSTLRGRFEAIGTRARSLAEHPRRLEGTQRRAEIMAAFSRPAFWDDAERARTSMSELAELDDREGAHGALERRIEGVADLVRDGARGAAPLAAKAHGILDEIESALVMLEHRTLVAQASDRADVVLALGRVGNTSEAAELLVALANLYEAWAEHHERALVRIDLASDESGPAAIALHVSGLGLYGLLRGEGGLHRLAEVGRGAERRRAAVRVTVMACPETAPDVRVERGPKRKGRVRATVIHAPSTTSVDVELASDLPAKEADAALAAWIGARLGGIATTRDDVVRRYGVEDRYAVDEDTALRFRTKDLPLTGLDEVFAARAEAQLVRARDAT